MDFVETQVLYFYRGSKECSWSFTLIILIWDPFGFSCAYDCHFNNTFSSSSKCTLGIQVFRRANVGSFTPCNSNSIPSSRVRHLLEWCAQVLALHQSPRCLLLLSPWPSPDQHYSQWVNLRVVWLSSLDVHDIVVRPSLLTCLPGDEPSASCCWVLQATPPSFVFPRLRFVRSCACAPRMELSRWFVVWMPYLLKGL